ncbi:GTP cyclohydrolase FolE2 [Alteromonas sp. D210916BOD_24]|uniref:GTP cyclohydrolase FolE2 n=1 Tax=Alteromonas sp. D210916BOD_24 TaxID=3157618 RepID=UPI00399CE23F
MSQQSNPTTVLSDVVRDSAAHICAPINWVGMEGIAIPIKVLGKDNVCLASHGEAHVSVSLDNHQAKGIHMSRLYHLLQQHLSNQILNTAGLTPLMTNLVASQEGLSQEAKLDLTFDLNVLRPAMVSHAFGYQKYAARLSLITKGKATSATVNLTVPYSSTCPCSASLSRQALAEEFEKQFNGQSLSLARVKGWLNSIDSSIATPHAQRSLAHVTLEMSKPVVPDFVEIIDRVEHALGTPLQTAVKREDEQAFAKRNAQNLMFVEDAARRLHATLSKYYHATRFCVKVVHQESLHAHDAVATISGIVNTSQYAL